MSYFVVISILSNNVGVHMSFRVIIGQITYGLRCKRKLYDPNPKSVAMTSTNTPAGIKLNSAPKFIKEPKSRYT